MTAPDVASLLAQIAATEAVARAASTIDHGTLHAERTGERYVDQPYWAAYCGGGDYYDNGLHIDPERTPQERDSRIEAVLAGGYEQDDQSRHIALNDPARVLARCAADREIVALHVSSPDPLHEDRIFCDVCDDLAPCPTLRALATAYAGLEGERHE
jgi:hypothetical protein